MLRQATRPLACCGSRRAVRTRSSVNPSMEQAAGSQPAGQPPKVVDESRRTQASSLAMQIQQFNQITADLHRLASDSSYTQGELLDAATRAKTLPTRLDVIVEGIASKKDGHRGALGYVDRNSALVNAKEFLTGAALGSIVAVCCGCPIDMVSFLSHPDGIIAGLAPKEGLIGLVVSSWFGPIMIKRRMDYVRCKRDSPRGFTCGVFNSQGFTSFAKVQGGRLDFAADIQHKVDRLVTQVDILALCGAVDHWTLYTARWRGSHSLITPGGTITKKQGTPIDICTRSEIATLAGNLTDLTCRSTPSDRIYLAEGLQHDSELERVADEEHACKSKESHFAAGCFLGLCAVGVPDLEVLCGMAAWTPIECPQLVMSLAYGMGIYGIVFNKNHLRW